VNAILSDMSAWFTEADLTKSPLSAQRLFTDLCQLLDQLDPANLAADQQTATADKGGDAIKIRLVHTNNRNADLDIEVGDRTTHTYGLYGFDEDYALPDDPEEVWRADTIDTIAGLLRGHYLVERLSWHARPYRTRVTDPVANARDLVTLDSFLGLLPLPRHVLTATTHEIDYACRGQVTDISAQH
jgi:hypothetical protein